MKRTTLILFTLSVTFLSICTFLVIRGNGYKNNITANNTIATSESVISNGKTFQPTMGDYFVGDTSKYESEYLDWMNAATQGNEWAQCRMGDFSFEGCAGYTDYSDALKWWLMSAEQGNVVAKYKLIKFYWLESFELWCKSHPFLYGLFF